MTILVCICFSELTKKEKEEKAKIDKNKNDLSAQKVCHSRQGHSKQTR